MSNLTVSLGQTGNSKFTTWYDGEVMTCYNSTELLKIANMSVEFKKIKDLYHISEQQLVLKDSALFFKTKALFAKDLVINSKNESLKLKEEIIAGKDTEITSLRNALDKANRKIKWGKFKLAGSTVILSGAAIFLLLN